MAALWNRAGHHIFALWFLLSLFFLSFFSSPNLGRRRLDVYHTFLGIQKYTLNYGTVAYCRLGDAWQVATVAILYQIIATL